MKGGAEMLPLEAISVLGIFYCFFMYGTWRALRAYKTVRTKAEAELGPTAARTGLKTTRQSA